MEKDKKYIFTFLALLFSILTLLNIITCGNKLFTLIYLGFAIQNYILYLDIINNEKNKESRVKYLYLSSILIIIPSFIILTKFM